MTDYEQGWFDGTRNAASVLAGKAKELRGIGNGTADLMARIFEEQVDAIMANSPVGSHAVSWEERVL